MPPAETALVVHGHYYQPPRENPWTGHVEREAGARPFHDWNERIDAECYRANAAARISDRFGRVTKIVNNYERTSFNVGPTLASWLARRRPETLRAMVEADAASARRLGGHGNAVAQAYSHAILPLANARDRLTQIRWGLADFRERFGREAEALWLPETAANDEVLAALADEGLRFAILAPEQARRVRPLGSEEEWTVVSADGERDGAATARLDPSRPYLWRRPGGGRSLALFFYDGALARAVAFEGVLASSQGLVDRFVRAAERGGPLVHVATDGETYGHHFRFGEKCLAYALEVEAPARGFAVTNYGELLDRFPPTDEVELDLGPDGEGSSWSCAHGVGRWRRDCGCQTGGKEGYRQAWRGPLRAALDFLRDEAAGHFEAALGGLVKDPWAARDAYGALLPHVPGSAGWNAACDALLSAHARRPLDAGDRVRALSLLSLQRHAVLMYASCGWFFNDLAGLETVHVLRYAGRVLDDLASLSLPSPEAGFLSILSEAKSNVASEGNGADVYRRHVAPARVSPQRVAAHLSLTELVEPIGPAGEAAGYGFVMEELRRERQGRLKVATARVVLTELATGRAFDFTSGAAHLGGVDFYAVSRAYEGAEAHRRAAARFWRQWETGSLPSVLRVLSEELGPAEFDVKDVLPEGRAAVFDAVFGDLVRQLSAQFARLYDDNRRLVDVFVRAGFDVPPVLRAAAEFSLSRRLLEEVRRQGESRDPKGYEEAIRIADEAVRHGFEMDRTEARLLFDETLAKAVREAAADPTSERAGDVAELLVLAGLLGIETSFERAQEELWPRLREGPASEELSGLALLLGFAPEEA